MPRHLLAKALLIAIGWQLLPNSAAGPPSGTCSAGGRRATVFPLLAVAASPRHLKESGQSGTGPYFDWRKWLPVVGLFLLWLGTVRWVDVDAGALRLPRPNWNLAVSSPWCAGFILLLLIPSYWLGFAVLTLSYSVPVAFYVTRRNRQVDTSRRVLSRGHLQKLPVQFIGGLTRALTGGPAGLGPPVKLLTKKLAGGDDEDSISPHAESSRGQRAARELIYDAVKKGATDIHLEPTEDAYSVRIRIDGSLKVVEPFDRKLGGSVVNIFKVMSALDIADRRHSQDGSFRAEVDGKPIDFRVATQATQLGEKISLRLLDAEHSLSTLESLGLRKALREMIRNCIQQKHGLFLVCGPTGAGKTTTLYAALRVVHSPQKNIISVEDPIEYQLEGINQIEVNTKGGGTFVSTLRNILRQDPDVLLIGEIRDPETATIACQAANTGHVVLSTIHANDVVTALSRLLELGVEPFSVANSIVAVLGQRLIRRLCPHCKMAYQPDEQTLEELGLPADRVNELYRPGRNSQCNTCAGYGYVGRIGVFEYLHVSPRLRDMISERMPANAILFEARAAGLLSLRDEGLGLVARGITSLEELNQVVGERTA